MGIKAYTDGACRVSNPGICSAAFVVYDDGVEIAHEGIYLGPEVHTNNFAEYQGLLALLNWALANDQTDMRIFCDSKLVVCQVNGEWNTRDELAPLTRRAQVLLLRGSHTLAHIRGHQGILGNERADQLCNSVLDYYHPRKTKGSEKLYQEMLGEKP